MHETDSMETHSSLLASFASFPFTHRFTSEDLSVVLPYDFLGDLDPLPILTCFRHENFLTGSVEQRERDYYEDPTPISAELYDRIKPGLRLATQFLFNAKLLLQRLQYSDLLQPRDAKSPNDLCFSDKPINVSDEQWLQDFDELTEDLRFYQHTEPTASGRRPDHAGLEACQCNLNLGWTTMAPLWVPDTTIAHWVDSRAEMLVARVLISLRKEIFEQIGSDDWYYRPLPHRLNLLLGLASTLAHEMSHAVFQCRSFPELQDAVDFTGNGYLVREPRPVKEWTNPELGAASEISFLGGALMWTEMITCSAHGCLNLVFDGRNRVLFTTDRENTKLLSQTTLLDLFLPDTWSRSSIAGDLEQTLHVWLLPVDKEGELTAVLNQDIGDMIKSMFDCPN